MHEVIILEPSIDQALTTARYLRRLDKDARIIGGVLKGLEPKMGLRPPYHEIREFTLDQLMESGRDRLVVPTGSMSTAQYAGARGDFQIGEAIFKKDNLRASDKLWALSTVSELGIARPRRFSDMDGVDEFPIFFKSKMEGDHQRGILRSRNELENLPNKENLLFEEYIRTPNSYGVYFLAQEGEILTQLTIKAILEIPPTGGSGVVMERIEDDRLLDHTRRLLKKMGYSGWGMTEFKHSPSMDEYVFMELNAKLCASVEFLYLNNPDFLGRLFGVRYKKKDVKRIVFADRLLDYGLKAYLLNLVKFAGSHFVDIGPSMNRALGMAKDGMIHKIR